MTMGRSRETCEWLQRALDNEEDQFLLGNHCFAYVSYEIDVIWGYCGGWNRAKQQMFHLYFPGDKLLQLTGWMAECQDWLLSHAGLTNGLYRTFSRRQNPADIVEWLDMGERALREGVAHPAFVAGRDRGGQYNFGGVLWCDWERFAPIKGVRQIVGHTVGDSVRWKRENVCLDTSLRHYGLLDEGKLTVMEVAG